MFVKRFQFLIHNLFKRLLDSILVALIVVSGVAFGFADGTGQTVASAVSVHDGVQLFVDATGRGSASATFRKIPLLKGEYSVTVFLVTEDALTAYDQRENCLRFKVAQDSLEQGLVSLKHDWH